MTTLEELEAEAAERYPIHDEDGCSCWCGDCKESRVERRVYVQARTVPPGKRSAVAAVLREETNICGDDIGCECEAAVGISLELATAALEAAGLYVEKERG